MTPQPIYRPARQPRRRLIEPFDWPLLVGRLLILAGVVVVFLVGAWYGCTVHGG